MPLYEYRCLECQHEFEVLVPAGRAEQATCPECGVQDVRRLLSMFAAPRGQAGASAWDAGPAGGGDGAAAPGGCCGGACGHC